MRTHIPSIGVIVCAALFAIGAYSVKYLSDREAEQCLSVSAAGASTLSRNEAKLSEINVDSSSVIQFDLLDRGDKGYLTLDDFRWHARSFLEPAVEDGCAGGRSIPRYQAAYLAIKKAEKDHLTKEEYLAAARARFADAVAAKTAAKLVVDAR